MTENNIGERIRERRIQLGLSQEELAERVGYNSRTTINKIEKSTRGMPQPKITKFAKALDTTEVYLLGVVDDPEWRMPAPEADYVMHLNSGEAVLIETYRMADDDKKRLVAYVLGLQDK